ncbi:MAG: lysylphosphatidylglycerol synthase transmembrane domain-containing protein [Anaerolineae bacterium]
MRKRLIDWAKIVISLGLLAVLLWRVGAQQTLDHLLHMDPFWFALAVALYFMGVWLRAWRWQGLLRALDLNVGLGLLTNLYFVGMFFNVMLPSGVGGDVVRIYELSKDGRGAANATSSVLMDRAAGLVTLMAQALITLIIAWAVWPGIIQPSVALAIVVISAGTLIATIALLSVDYLRRWLAVIPFLTRWLEKPGIRRFAESFKSYRGPALYRALAVSFVFNLQLVVVNYCLGLALHINLPFVYYLLFVPIVSFVLSLPISWGGLGARETAYVLLFTSVGVPSDQALALSLAFYAVNLLTGAVGGVLYLMSGIRGAREDAAAADGPTTKQV